MHLLNNMQEPLYKQVEEFILRKISNHEYLPGAKLPGTRQLAKKYGINRLTVNKAINNLAQAGVLSKKPSSGTYVNKRIKSKSNAIDLNFSNSGLMSIIKKQGVILDTKVVNKDIFHGIPYFAHKLNLTEKENIFGIHRLRLIRNTPVALEYNYVPLKFFPDINQIDFNRIGLYDYMISKKHKVEHNNTRLITVNAKKKEADLMLVKEGTTFFKIQYINSDANYNIVEYTESYLLPQEINPNFKVHYSNTSN